MRINRRDCLHAVIAGAGAVALPSSRAGSLEKIKAVAFDAFPIFDPRPIFALAEQLFPGKGAALSNVWRTRQFEYQWLRALGGHYVDFWQATEDALKFAAKSTGLDLPSASRSKLMNAYLDLKAWPDVLAGLKAFKEAGIRLAFLSNATPKILNTGITNSGLNGLFEHVLSTDAIRSYKPDPRAYQLAVEAFGLKREEIAFAAFAGWDVAGAKWFGYPTFWVNRAGAPAEELGVAPDGTGRGLADLAKFAGL